MLSNFTCVWLTEADDAVVPDPVVVYNVPVDLLDRGHIEVGVFCSGRGTHDLGLGPHQHSGVWLNVMDWGGLLAHMSVEWLPGSVDLLLFAGKLHGVAHVPGL